MRITADVLVGGSHEDCYKESMWQDIKLALRGFRKTPAFTMVAVTSLALGIGANSAIFSFVNAILLKRLPVTEPERLVTFAELRGVDTSGLVARTRTVDELAKRNSVFDGLFGWFAKPVNFSTGETGQWVMGELVTGQYFRTLKVKPAVGRLLTDDDVRNAAGNPVCVLSYALWQREFAGDSGVVGRTVFLNGHAYRVLGVTARGFHGAELQHRFDVQIPATQIGDFMPAFGSGTGVDWLKTMSWMDPMARCKPGIRRIEAQQRAERLFRQIEIENSGGHPETPANLRLKDGSQGFNTMRSEFGRPVMVLMAVVGIVLLVACANLANLLLARAQARAKEFGVRVSIGASRGRLIRQLLVESLELAVCGGVLGMLLSFWIDKMLLSLLNTGRSAVSAIHVAVDSSVVAFSIGLCFATTIVFGLVPAWLATGADPLTSLRDEVASGGRISRALVRRALVVAQIALSLAVIFAAGLLTRTLRTLETIDLGFKPAQVIALNVDPASNGHSSAEISRILEEIRTRVRVLPGVSAASLAASTPNGFMEISLSIEVPGYTRKSDSDEIVGFNFVSPDYFATLGQPLLGGRDFSERDDKNAPRTAIVNEKFVRHYFAGRYPIGRKFRQGGGDVEIVGVVADARDRSIRGGPEEMVYVPEKQGQTSGLMVLVRTESNPKVLIPSLLAMVRSIDKRLPVYSVHTLDLDIQAGLSSERILGYLSTLFAVLATLLAGIGLYGVLAYSVVRRTREIGIRFAIGAQRRDVAGLFARESLMLVAAGVVIGGIGGLAATRVLKSLLFGVGTTDLVTLVVSVVVLSVAAVLATALPVWRATSVDPMNAIRYE
jgi:predicted permease